MSGFRAVLFDFGDTLFARAGAHRTIVEAAARLGVVVGDEPARELWEAIQAGARTPEELAKGRDLSAEAHRRCWTDLYRAAEFIAPGIAELLYEAESDPTRWVPFPDTEPTLRALAERGIPVGVVSDTGWDIRPVFEALGLADLVGVFVMSFEWGVAKPAAALFTAACERLGTTAAETLMIGDNPLTDGGAVAAGLTAHILPAARSGLDRGLAAAVALVGGALRAF